MENLFYTILISVDFAQYEILRAKVCKFWEGCCHCLCTGIGYNWPCDNAGPRSAVGRAPDSLLLLLLYCCFTSTLNI